MTDVLHFEVDHGVGLLRLNRPEVHNAVDEAVLEALEESVARLDAAQDAVRAVVLTGSGKRTFCAGADLSWIAALEDRRRGLDLCRRMQSVLEAFHGGPRPVIAAIGGDAFGGGCELALACHLRIASVAARFCFRQTSMGLATGWGGGSRLFRQVGRSAGLRLVLTGEAVDAAEAQRLGLVDKVSADGETLDDALEMARKIAAGSVGSVRAFLELARAVENEGGRGGAEEVEAALFAKLWDGESFARRLDAWAARRREAGSVRRNGDGESTPANGGEEEPQIPSHRVV